MALVARISPAGPLAAVPTPNDVVCRLVNVPTEVIAVYAAVVSVPLILPEYVGK